MKRVPGGGRRDLAAIALMVAFLAAGSWSRAEAAVLKVNNQAACSDATGSPNYCTIRVAVTKAQPGDTVSVAAGTYRGEVFIDRSGTAGNPIRIVTSQGAVVRSKSRGFDIAGASWITIKGFTIYWTGSDGIRCTLCSNVDLIENRVRGARGNGILVNNASDVYLQDNKVRRSKFTGVEVAGSTRVTISGGLVAYSGSPISGKSYKGIKFTNSTNSTVLGTKVYGNSDTGIYLLNGTTGVRIKGVISHHNAREYIPPAAAGIEARSPGNIIEASTVYSNEDSGINMRWGGSDALIANNLAYWNRDHGIDILESPRPKIVNNSVHDNGTAGVNLEGNSYDGLVKNNISSDNGIGSTRTKGNIRITNSSMPATADRNIVWASDNGIIYQWGLTYFSNLSTMRSVNPLVEPNGYEANPLWADASAGDFHLTAGSKAIDSAQSDAITSGEIDQDATGNARCDDTAVGNTGSGPKNYMDRGALEFVSGC